MTVRAVALLSGGLDSMLAIRVVQAQGIEVEALNFRTLFACCQDTAALAARELGVRLSVLSEQDDYLELIKRPQHGYGRGANPCVDCRIYMFRLAARWIERVGADFVISGEVVGQRPMSQKKRDLLRIAHHAGLEDRLLRPLSAKLLPVTLAERTGLVDRAQLFGFSGRGRKELIALARGYGFVRIPDPSTGCALTEPRFAAKVHDLVQIDASAGRWDFDLLKVGRHVRRDESVKVVVGRREEENAALVRTFHERGRRSAVLVTPENFLGPTALVVGAHDAASVAFAGGLILRYAKAEDIDAPTAIVDDGHGQRALALEASEAASIAGTL